MISELKLTQNEQRYQIINRNAIKIVTTKQTVITTLLSVQKVMWRHGRYKKILTEI